MLKRYYALAFLVIFSLLLFSGCQSYTQRNAKAIIEAAPQPGETQVIITKYSQIEAAELAKAEAALERQKAAEQAQKEREQEENFQKTQAELESLAIENNSYEKANTTLTAEKEILMTDNQSLIQENNSLKEENINLETENRALTEETQSVLQDNTSLREANQTFTAENQSLSEANLELTEKSLTLTEAKGKLETENQTLTGSNKILKEEIQALKETNQALNEANNALTEENRDLKNQASSLQLTLDTKLRLEMEKADRERQAQEAKILAEKQKEKAIADAEKARLAELERIRKAQEEEIMQIPPLGQITFPRLYSTARPSILAMPGEKLKVLMLPLDDTPWVENNTAEEVAKSISDLQVPVIFVTGNMSNVVALVRFMGYDAVLFESGAILSDFNIKKTDENGMVVQYTKDKELRLSLANLPQYSVMQAFLEKKEWKSLQESEAPARIQKVRDIILEGSNTMPTIIGSSLYEPSYQDWNTFSPIPYRQMEFLWPLCDTFEQEGFYDTYRVTHYNAATDAGNTLRTKDLEERVDYIFTRKVLPLMAGLLTAGPLSVPDANGISRFALYGTFLVP
jgi:hypothetical protein